MQQVLLSERQYHFIFMYNVMAFVMYFPNVLPFVFDGDFVVFSSLPPFLSLAFSLKWKIELWLVMVGAVSLSRCACATIQCFVCRLLNNNINVNKTESKSASVPILVHNADNISGARGEQERRGERQRPTFGFVTPLTWMASRKSHTLLSYSKKVAVIVVKCAFVFHQRIDV